MLLPKTGQDSLHRGKEQQSRITQGIAGIRRRSFFSTGRQDADILQLHVEHSVDKVFDVIAAEDKVNNFKNAVNTDQQP